MQQAAVAVPGCCKHVLCCRGGGLVSLPCCCARELELPKLGMPQLSLHHLLKLQVCAAIGRFISPLCYVNLS